MKSSNFIWFFFSVLAGFLLAGIVILFNNRDTGTSVTLIPAPTALPIKVFLSGNIEKPGVYELPPSSRVEDLFVMAEIDTQINHQYNLAAKLYDGQQIIISSNNLSLKEISVDNFSKININEAGIDELVELPGIGETRARDIILYRESNGYFDRIEDILNVPGIGQSTFNQIKDKIVTNSISQ
ncbi:MAG: helix-hairpin-helix domain-containing protein [Anaerolineaceae bacterium]|nr:helix-hairpin-helix domain-containing protein [Anaerolineaceae bacterium]